jgi:hypothetical protein
MLSTIEFDSPGGATEEHALNLLTNHGGHEGREILQLTNGNAFVAYTDQSEGVTAFSWEVVHPIPPDTLRMGVFTFTVRTEAANSPEVVGLVTMLTREIAQSAFAD